MKIAVVAPEHPYSGARGGIARYLRDYLPALAKSASVTLVSIENGPALPGIEQRIIPSCSLPSPFRPPVYSRRIQRILDSMKPDVVEYANWLGLGCAEQGQWPVVVRLSTPVRHGSLRAGLLPRLARPIHHRWEQETAEKAHLWISNTQQNLHTCRSVYGIEPPSEVIPHGVAFNEFSPYAGAKDLLFVGRFEHRKGVDLLLQAWTKLVAEGLTGQRWLHLVGRDTPGENGSFLEACFRELRTTPEDIQVTVEGNLAEPELCELRRRCAIAVIPSRYESFGMVALEAFAAGQLVIASDAGGLKEVVSHGRTGLLFESERPEALAAALAGAMKNSTRASEYIQAARKALYQRFSPERMAESSLQAYEKAIALHGVGRKDA